MADSEQSHLPAHALVENGTWAIIFHDLPWVHGEGDSLALAIDDAVTTLQEYCEDWDDHLHRAPNHAQHGELVQWIGQQVESDLKDHLFKSVLGDKYKPMGVDTGPHPDPDCSCSPLNALLDYKVTCPVHDKD